MTIIAVPFHLDEYLPDLDLPWPAGKVITAMFQSEEPWSRLAELYDQVAEAVRTDLAEGRRPVVCSGDCTTSLGIVAGLNRAGVRPSIVWFDAHGDLQTPQTTTTGYLGGMPLRLLVGHQPEIITARLGISPVPERQVALVGARDLDPPELDYLSTSAVRRIDVEDLEDGVLPDGPIYLHLDVDVADPTELPGLLVPAPGGPRLDAVARAVRCVLDSGRVAAVGVGCTWRPNHGNGERVRAAIGTP